MGGKALPFIAYIYLSWRDYCYVTKVVIKTDYALAKLLSYVCRYFDDICTVNLKYFGGIAKDISDNTLLLESSTCHYRQDTFYWRLICGWHLSYSRWFQFRSNQLSFPTNQWLGYTNSQLIRFIRLCNNMKDFLFLVTLRYYKLAKCGCLHSLLIDIKKCLTPNIGYKYGEKTRFTLFSHVKIQPPCFM